MTVLMVCVCGDHRHDSSNGVCMGITGMTVLMVCVCGDHRHDSLVCVWGSQA